MADPKKNQITLQNLERRVKMLEEAQRNSTTYDRDFGQRKIFRRDVQFLGKVYDDDGNVVTEINP